MIDPESQLWVPILRIRSARWFRERVLALLSHEHSSLAQAMRAIKPKEAAE